MNSLFYVIAVIMLIGWLVGVFIYSVTGLIHILLVLAVLAIAIRFIKGK
ncbi:lmo0937 family membrane protein [Algoriphagus pacificus]|uniref:Lmo0937 family membrane protein n=1 Tax=Algoriphagus pacificus TaxID=2811234 RepID=A0ABS3CHG0_9BACT|nr:lmo0937 family membrane protein [Algoriphagus pacificus]MBN7816467.1 lmo0937 family membrane protein [Algoriphagus pacificus]